MTPALTDACEKALHILLPDGGVLRGGRAALFILEAIGWTRTARLLRRQPLILVVEAVYALVSRNRPFFARFLFTRNSAEEDDIYG